MLSNSRKKSLPTANRLETPGNKVESSKEIIQREHDISDIIFMTFPIRFDVLSLCAGHSGFVG
jgi:hypothetical protein